MSISTEPSWEYPGSLHHVISMVSYPTAGGGSCLSTESGAVDLTTYRIQLAASAAAPVTVTGAIAISGDSSPNWDSGTMPGNLHIDAAAPLLQSWGNSSLAVSASGTSATYSVTLQPGEFVAFRLNVLGSNYTINNDACDQDLQSVPILHSTMATTVTSSVGSAGCPAVSPAYVAIPIEDIPM